MVSARRVLAIAGAILSLALLGAFVPLLVEDAAAGWLVLWGAGALWVLAVPLVTDARGFGLFALGAAGFLVVTGFLVALVGGLVLWPGAALLAAAGLWRPDSTWRRSRVALVVAGVVVALALVAGAVAAAA
ncbi:MAG TPA: hypothetical protein VNO33_07000 [Kofleriaceae bacterium]|nr:hypothetical protein [Kofleriaceae bacterium]